MEVGSQPTLAAKLTPAIPQTQPAFLNKVSRPLYWRQVFFRDDAFCKKFLTSKNNWSVANEKKKIIAWVTCEE